MDFFSVNFLLLSFKSLVHSYSRIEHSSRNKNFIDDSLPEDSKDFNA